LEIVIRFGAAYVQGNAVIDLNCCCYTPFCSAVGTQWVRTQEPVIALLERASTYAHASLAGCERRSTAGVQQCHSRLEREQRSLHQHTLTGLRTGSTTSFGITSPSDVVAVTVTS
jgi:hypothetical protein